MAAFDVFRRPHSDDCSGNQDCGNSGGLPMTDPSSDLNIIQVNPSIQYLDMATNAVRSFVMVAGAVTALAGLVSQHDWRGAIAYIQGTPFTTALATVMSLGAFAWGLWKTHKRGGQLITAAVDPRNVAVQLTSKGN